MNIDENGRCKNCGMEVKIGDYHPELACYAYKACRDREKVLEMSKEIYSNLFIEGVKQAVSMSPRQIFENCLIQNGMTPTYIRLTTNNKVFIERCELDEAQLKHVAHSLGLALKRATP